jgi:hypothetical protein
VCDRIEGNPYQADPKALWAPIVDALLAGKTSGAAASAQLAGVVPAIEQDRRQSGGAELRAAFDLMIRSIAKVRADIAAGDLSLGLEHRDAGQLESADMDIGHACERFSAPG